MGLPSSEPSPEALTEAIDLYREIGMPKHLEMAEELLGRRFQAERCQLTTVAGCTITSESRHRGQTLASSDH